MWPACIAELEPFEFQLKAELPKFIKQMLEKANLPDETFVPVKSLTLLGKCRTDAFLECPNLPEHHVESANGGDRYFHMVGKYYWFDFDACTPDNGPALPLRAVFNVGDSDTNDGIWGCVWHRSSGECVANITSSGISESTIEVVSKRNAEQFQHANIPILDVLDNETKRDRLVKTPNPIPCERLIYSNQQTLERIIGLAISLCGICSSQYVYRECGFND